MRKSRLLTILGVAILGGVAAFFIVTAPRKMPSSAFPARQADLRNGETMFHVGGCASCHAVDFKAAPLSLGGGHQLKTGFGTFVVPNISPDPKTGIGDWSEAEFATAMLKGVGRNGEHLYPAFPYTSYQRMRVEDVRDLFAFMKTLPPVDKPNAPHQLGFPFSVRAALGGWKLLFLDGQEFTPDPGRSAAVNRGAYLVEGPGHCAECHSSRNVLGAITPAGRWAGGPNAEGKGFVPNISQHPQDGLGDWSVMDIATLLKDGGTPAGAFVADEMEHVVQNTARLSAEDRTAMAEYLKTLPSRPGRRPTPGR